MQKHELKASQVLFLDWCVRTDKFKGKPWTEAVVKKILDGNTPYDTHYKSIRTVLNVIYKDNIDEYQAQRAEKKQSKGKQWE